MVVPPENVTCEAQAETRREGHSHDWREKLAHLL